MLSREECRYLHWLGKELWTGRGLIVEVGPWLGGSTLCLAGGMSKSGHNTRHMLHVIDNFIWREFMSGLADLPLQAGESFEPYFKKNLEPFWESIVVYRNALPDEELDHDEVALKKRYGQKESVPFFGGLVTQEPVQILFIDGAKSWRAMKTLLNLFSGQMRSGDTLLVCQDFKYWETYWVPMMMMRLVDFVEVLHNVRNGTTVTFRLKKAIPASFLEEIEDHVAAIDTERGLLELTQASETLKETGDWEGSRHVNLGKVAFLAHQDKVDLAIDAFNEAQASWPRFSSIRQLERARSYLEDRAGVRLKRPCTLTIGPSVSHQFRRLAGHLRRCR